jgi:hypothetical protein
VEAGPPVLEVPVAPIGPPVSPTSPLSFPTDPVAPASAPEPETMSLSMLHGRPVFREQPPSSKPTASEPTAQIDNQCLDFILSFLVSVVAKSIESVSLVVRAASTRKPSSKKNRE